MIRNIFSHSLTLNLNSTINCDNDLTDAQNESAIVYQGN